MFNSGGIAMVNFLVEVRKRIQLRCVLRKREKLILSSHQAPEDVVMLVKKRREETIRKKILKYKRGTCEENLKVVCVICLECQMDMQEQPLHEVEGCIQSNK